MKKNFLSFFMLVVISFIFPECMAVTDVGGTKYEDAVTYLIENNIISGYQDNTFRPNNTITRAEITTIITKLNNLELLENKNTKFNDVDNHWAKKYINTLAEAGFVSGYETGDFKPNDDITYGEVVTMLLNSLGYKEEVMSLPVEWPQNYINMGGILRLFDDWGNETHYAGFSSRKVTRGEAAILIYNSMNIERRIEEISNVVTIRDTDSEELKIEKVTVYLEILKDYYSIHSFPSFDDINEADEGWIWSVVDGYARRIGFSYDQYISKNMLDLITKGIFGTKFSKPLPKHDKYNDFKVLDTNPQYYELGWRDVYEFDTYIYIENVKFDKNKIIVNAIPYYPNYELAGDMDWFEIYDLTGELVVKKNVNFKWEDILETVEDNKHSFSKNIIELEIDEKTGNLHIVSCQIEKNEIVTYEYDCIREFSEGMAAVEKDGKWGFINKNGEEIIPLIYDNVGDFSEGLANAEKDCKFGYIDKKGENIIDFIYYTAEPFLDGIAKVSFVDISVSAIEKYGYIDCYGNPIIPCVNNSLINLGNGKIIANENYNIYIYNKEGNIVSEYDWIYEFSEGVAVVRNKVGKYGYINEFGEEVISCQYDWASKFSEGMAEVGLNKEKGYINKNGTLVIPFGFGNYETVGVFCEGMAKVENKTGYGYIDKTGEEVIPCIYKYADAFSEGVANVNKEGKWGYIDKTGRVVIPFIYSEAHPFDNGLAYVCIDNKGVYIDKNGNVSNINSATKEEMESLEELGNLLCDAYKADTLDNLLKDMEVGNNLTYQRLKSFYNLACDVAENAREYVSLGFNRDSYQLADIDNDGVEDILIDYNWGSIGQNDAMFLKGLGNGKFKATSFYDVTYGYKSIVEYNGIRFEYRNHKGMLEDFSTIDIYLWKNGKQIAGKRISVDSGLYNISVDECKNSGYESLAEKYVDLLNDINDVEAFAELVGMVEVTNGKINDKDAFLADINNDGVAENYTKSMFFTSTQSRQNHVEYEIVGRTDTYFFDLGIESYGVDDCKWFLIDRDYLGENTIVFIFNVEGNIIIDAYKIRENNCEKVFSISKKPIREYDVDDIQRFNYEYPMWGY